MQGKAKFTVAALVLQILVVAGLGFPLKAHAGTAEGVSYILANQAADGGFREPGRGDAGQDATTAWCVMALKAAGVDPRETRKNGRSPLDFLATQCGNWRSVTDYERTLLAVAAAGENPRSFAGVDLVAKLQSYQSPGGNIGDAVNSNVFGILAYRAAGVAVPSGAVQWQRQVQNPDGGWGNSPGAASNPDMTAASIMALRAAGVEAGDPAITSALSYLHAIQNQDGGFSFQPGASDTAATSWCVQAIVAAGQDPGGSAWSRGGNTPLSFVRSMQMPDGRFMWMSGRDMNPVWTTSYAVCALAGKPFPVAVTRSPSSHAGGEATTTSGADGGKTGAGAGGEAAKGKAFTDPGGETSLGESEQAGETATDETATNESARGREEESAEGEVQASSEATQAGDRGGFPVVPVIAAMAGASLLPLSWWLYRRRPWRSRGKSAS